MKYATPRQHLMETLGIATADRQARVDHGAELDRLALGERLDRGDRRLDERSHVEGLDVEDDLAGLDL